MPISKNNHRIAITLPKELVKELNRRAEEEMRTISSIIILALKHYYHKE